MESLPPVLLGATLFIPFMAALLFRKPLESLFVLSSSFSEQPKRQFLMDFSICILVGIAVMIHNKMVYSFPAISGFKIVLGCVVMGLFLSLDTALERERIIINKALTDGTDLFINRKFSPMTRRFSFMALITTLFIALAIGLVVSGDVVWLSGMAHREISISDAKWEIINEIIFVCIVVISLVVNLILSYSKNLAILFNNETNVLERVSMGDLSQMVPVATSDEFGVIARHTNNMIRGLRHRLQIMTSLKLAEEVGQNLLPKYVPEIDGFDIAGKSIYCEETGGDYFDYLTEFHDGEEKLGVIVGDVSGHGIESALLMATVRAFIRQRSSMGGNISKIVSDVNRELTRDVGNSGSFITLFYLQINRKEGRIRWVRAGHEPAIIFNPETGSFDELSGQGLPLGIREDSSYEELEMPYRAGQVIVIGTDGIWETHDPEFELFGKERLRETVKMNCEKSAEAIVLAVMDRVGAFRSSIKQEDDVTLVVIKVR